MSEIFTDENKHERGRMIRVMSGSMVETAFEVSAQLMPDLSVKDRRFICLLVALDAVSDAIEKMIPEVERLGGPFLRELAVDKLRERLAIDERAERKREAACKSASSTG